MLCVETCLLWVVLPQEIFEILRLLLVTSGAPDRLATCTRTIARVESSRFIALFPGLHFFVCTKIKCFTFMQPNKAGA